MAEARFASAPVQAKRRRCAVSCPGFQPTRCTTSTNAIPTQHCAAAQSWVHRPSSAFRKAAGSWSGGKLYDPATGKTYSGKIAANPDGTLKVQGCVFMICQTQT